MCLYPRPLPPPGFPLHERQWTDGVWRGGVGRLGTQDKGNRVLMSDSHSRDSQVFSSSLSVLHRWRFIVAICLTWTHLYSRLCIFIYANVFGDPDLVLRYATCARECERAQSYSTIKPRVGIKTASKTRILQHLDMKVFEIIFF